MAHDVPRNIDRSQVRLFADNLLRVGLSESAAVATDAPPGVHRGLGVSHWVIGRVRRLVTRTHGCLHHPRTSPRHLWRSTAKNATAGWRHPDLCTTARPAADPDVAGGSLDRWLTLTRHLRCTSSARFGGGTLLVMDQDAPATPELSGSTVSANAIGFLVKVHHPADMDLAGFTGDDAISGNARWPSPRWTEDEHHLRGSLGLVGDPVPCARRGVRRVAGG